jgi:uncharacterized protein (TIGR02145 family)
VRCLKDEAPAAQLIVTPESQTVSPSSGTALFDVSSNITWIVSENVGWLAVTPTSGNSNGTFTVTYDENLSAELRTGSIIVISADGVLQQTVTIIQSGAQAWSCGQPITDVRDGKTYSTVQIGTQCWMAGNLNVGTMINGGQEMTDNSIVEKYCNENDVAYCDVYGGLYQWNEMMNYSTTAGVQGICPEGWHLPSYDEWAVLTTYLGGLIVAGGKMKEPGTTHWYSPNSGATNSSGFTALPGGYHHSEGTFANLGSIGFFWNSTESIANTALSWWLWCDGEYITYWEDEKAFGYSVRCVKNQ